MNKIRILLVGIVILVSISVYAQDINSNLQRDTSSAVNVRYEPVSGTSKHIRLQATDGSMVKVGSQYVQVDSNYAKRLGRKSCATFWYDVESSDDTGRYIIRSRTSKNAIGLSGSYLFYGDFTHHRDWLRDEYVRDFDGAAFALRDFNIGLLYARQLVAKNRHRLSMEIVPMYHQIRQIFSTNRYTTSFAAIDPDSYHYERLVTVNNYEEEKLRQCVSLQLNFRYDWFILKYFSLFLAAGIDNGFVVTDESDVTFDAIYAGRYGEEFFNSVIDENGYYDFGRYPSNRIVTKSEPAFRYSLYGSAFAGLQLFIGPVLSIEVAGVYHRLLYSNVSEESKDPFCLSESAGNYQSMVKTMKPAAKDRLGVNVKLKFNF